MATTDFVFFRKCLMPLSHYWHTLNLDSSNEYRTAVKASADDGDSSFSTDTAMRLFPRGTLLDVSVGWRSFYGTRLKVGDNSFYALGMRKVFKHNQGWAYTEQESCILRDRMTMVECLVTLVEDLKRQNSVSATPSLPPYGTFHSQSSTPQEHTPLEIAVLSFASEKFESQGGFRFSTLALTSEDIKLPYLRFNPTLTTIVRPIWEEIKRKDWLKAVLEFALGRGM